MPLNSTQRPIFVYLRSKNDHKSCTLAGAKLTNEYTHRTNKNDPSTISVIPSQLCTFFRKRTNFLGSFISRLRRHFHFPRKDLRFSTWGQLFRSQKCPYISGRLLMLSDEMRCPTFGANSTCKSHLNDVPLQYN